MELALSLGDTPFCKSKKTDLGFCMGVGKASSNGENNDAIAKKTGRPLVQLDLLPFSPVHRTSQPSSSTSKFLPFPWLQQNLISEPGINRARAGESEEGAATISSPNSTTVSPSLDQMDFSIFKRAIHREKTDCVGFSNIANNTIDIEVNNNNNEAPDKSRASSRGISDEELENGNLISRKKLRLSKQQSAFLEESFKEHNTLNPKQKQALAKELNLRPRQVEVWFQNRRARTKLKKTEVDCEHLKSWCEMLSQENIKLQREINELRALKLPFYMHRTLTMCPSCERVAPAAGRHFQLSREEGL